MDYAVFTIDSQHVTDPHDDNTESLCGLPVQGETNPLLARNKPTCERCLRILADRLAQARMTAQMQEANSA